MEPRTPNQILHGIDDPPREPRALHAGPLTAMLDGLDLRYVRAGSFELVRRVYVAVRDHHWNTIPPVYQNLRVDTGDDRFLVVCDVRHRDGDLDFSWKAIITGNADGRIRYAMDGVAGSDYPYNRIGLCVLHPPRESAGHHFRGETPYGPVDGTLPRLIGPQRFEHGVYIALFPAVNSLTIDLDDQHAVRFAFEGDLFEMEDQRNWTDASFKTYSTPMTLGFPHQATRGRTIAQSVAISLAGPPLPTTPSGNSLRLKIGQRTAHRLPAIGFGLPSDDRPLTQQEVALLSILRPDHLRVEVRADDPRSFAALDRAVSTANTLGCPLEVALFVRAGSDTSALDELASRLTGRVGVDRWLVYDADAQTAEPSETTSPALVRLARSRLHGVQPDAAFAGGTDMYFCELNRTRPQVDAMDAVCYTIVPQVHAFDDLSLIETVEAQAETVRSARAFAGDKPIVISPITLKRRFNPHATGPEGERDPDELPDSVDARQLSLLGAAWTVGSLASLAVAGAASLTYFETVGWRGLLEREGEPPLSARFPSSPGMLFPLYHVFADLATWKDGELTEIVSSHPQRVTALAIERAGSVLLLVANVTDEPQAVTIGTLEFERAHVRILSQATAFDAAFEPERFRKSGSDYNVRGGLLTIELPPFATARIRA